MQIPISFLEHIAYHLRRSSVELPTYAGSGHPTTCLSAAEIVTVLFWYVMRYDPDNFENPNADRFILSKGHASALLYAVWKELGKLSADELKTYRQFDSVLEGHPTFRFPYTEAATGSLGVGLSIAVGEALVAQRDNRPYRVYVLMGDAEIAEGSVWEAAQLASYYNLTNLVVIVDCNRLGQSAETMLGTDLEPYVRRFAAFGFTPLIANGNSIPDLMNTFDQLHDVTTPVAILAHTHKGYGVDFIEDKEGWHGKPLSPEQLRDALRELAQRFSAAATYADSYQWQPTAPATEPDISPTRSVKALLAPRYAPEKAVATRFAFGEALRDLGGVNDAVVVLDGDVQNSTYTEKFAEKYPERFVQCFIAEQNMVSVGVGMARRGKIPFIATFGAFFTRAHDQIRMAAIGQSPLRLVGSHAGVSIGQDGPSQMALEDIALMRALPNSIVLYPSDAVSAYRLTELMSHYTDGISYLRTTRMATPILYAADTRFTLGGCVVVREYPTAQACIVAAGVTLHEALKAHDILKKQGVLVSVIDLYSVKPMDTKTVKRVAEKSSHRIITVEDHYAQGGIGEAVCAALADSDIAITMLAVTELPRSGSPERLLSWAGIDAQGIIKAVTL